MAESNNVVQSHINKDGVSTPDILANTSLKVEANTLATKVDSKIAELQQEVSNFKLVLENLLPDGDDIKKASEVFSQRVEKKATEFIDDVKEFGSKVEVKATKWYSSLTEKGKIAVYIVASIFLLGLIFSGLNSVVPCENGEPCWNETVFQDKD